MSAAGAGMPWSPQQLAWLQAMGHVVYLSPEAVPLAPPVADAVDTAAPSRPATRTAASPAAPVRRAPPAPASTPLRHAPDAGRGGAAMRLPDRLHIALLRASGRGPADPQVQALLQACSLADLRADPAAKRALWPRLRALRRARPAG
ncbi:hypothetical protein [Xanthomonas massiliensis]|jgi:hypothetical protein|uniref:hypothetical protein n=1 Tax=Xanthomonas massiliensis TaxID=1720302 RepID=UPI0008253D46|nr:hypothetical protein [Xanthomonas massiliensis]